MDTVVTAEMLAAIGSRTFRKVSFPITASDIRRWAVAVYWPEPVPKRYLDAEESRLVAPEEFNPFAWALVEREPEPSSVGISEDEVILAGSVEKLLGVPGPGLRNELYGGFAVEYGAPMAVDDVITCVTTLVGYSERESRLGHMLTTTLEDAWTNQRGELVKRCQRRLIRY